MQAAVQSEPDFATVGAFALALDQQGKSSPLVCPVGVWQARLPVIR
jgi:hypothetical protein